MTARRAPLPIAWDSNRDLADRFAIYVAVGDALNENDTLTIDLESTPARKAS